MYPDPTHLWICVQQIGNGKWYWCVKYPEGLRYEEGTTDTSEHAFELGVLALRLLAKKK